MKQFFAFEVFTGLFVGLGFSLSHASAAEPNPQYELRDIKVAAASADEAKRESVSLPLALDYLEKGTQVWNGQRKCVTCHTNGIYMTVRPALSDKLGKPTESARQFFVETLGQLEGLEPEKLLQATRPDARLLAAL